MSAALETAEGFRRIRQTADREAGPSPLPALPVSALMSSPTVLTSGAPAPVQAALTASPWSPQFGAELGSQVSTWAADGVQHAQLHLNPAELGPVEVHIRIDGQEAHVMLHATQSETREALQSSVPELQQALQREGLQLGQTDVRGGRGDQPSGKPEFQPRSHFTPPAPNEGANPSARQRQHGLLDLYA
ncbi:flagellar hook-length control protein FliK [Inhella gelatinilytica]|uniref:Flagellar hook-length control protein FliK n=1 Tax=Inhella gelatinilytica TaxID=2795030 RepID=A0A931IZB6_9BURK|nr:flagellar hook-length control protein FliK [Inhella gelatinilytica]MBH9552743.1 flagellar hook-length control protein FliK [Inhella gelatinilytica]